MFLQQKWFIVLVGIHACGGAVAEAASKSSLASEVASEPYRVGVLLPLPETSPQLPDSAKKAQRRINRSGGILHHRLELMVVDSTPLSLTELLRELESLVADPTVKAVIASLTDEQKGVLVPWFRRRKIVLISTDQPFNKSVLGAPYLFSVRKPDSTGDNSMAGQALHLISRGLTKTGGRAGQALAIELQKLATLKSGYQASR
jgi:ABC-type branched-subunit amino acid transport system substrate-binding protein